jgi:hypothetical protein
LPRFGNTPNTALTGHNSATTGKNHPATPPSSRAMARRCASLRSPA